MPAIQYSINKQIKTGAELWEGGVEKLESTSPYQCVLQLFIFLIIALPWLMDKDLQALKQSIHLYALITRVSEPSPLSKQCPCSLSLTTYCI